MSRERNEEKKGLSPTQRKACVVLALCALAVVMSILAAWVLPTKLGLFAGGKDSYDPDAYPLDTTLDSICLLYTSVLHQPGDLELHPEAGRHEGLCCL